MLRSINIKSLSVAVSTLVLSTSVNAVVLNTLNGVDYEWLELADTQGLSRDVVELRLADVNDALYGYEYASRQLVEDLFLSYTSWDGRNGYYGSTSVVSGITNLIDDFGATRFIEGDGVNSVLNDVDGNSVSYDSGLIQEAMYGTTAECLGETFTCVSYTSVFADAGGTNTMALMYYAYGWDASVADNEPNIEYVTYNDPDVASFLVRTTVVPVPPAVWLFGSGLIGLIGIARRKKA